LAIFTQITASQAEKEAYVVLVFKKNVIFLLKIGENRRKS
jgi:hypothetical protein